MTDKEMLEHVRTILAVERAFGNLAHLSYNYSSGLSPLLQVLLEAVRAHLEGD